MVIERWSGAQVQATPAACDVRGTGVPSATVATTASGSAVSWISGDWTGVDGSGRSYITTSATPSEDGYVSIGGQYTGYWASQAADSAGPQSIGLTAPTGQTWTVLGIEIQAAATSGLTTAGVPAATGASNGTPAGRPRRRRRRLRDPGIWHARSGPVRPGPGGVQ